MDDLHTLANLEFSKAAERISAETRQRISETRASSPRGGLLEAAVLRIQLEAAERMCRALSDIWVELLEARNGGFLTLQDVALISLRVKEVAESRKNALLTAPRGRYPLASASQEVSRTMSAITSAINRDLQIRIRRQQAFRPVRGGAPSTQTAIAANPDPDHEFARRALEEARRSIAEDARVHPMVGVVVVKEGSVLATAYRGEISGSHAEYIALERKLKDVPLSGATVYTTLEPCTTRNHPNVPCAKRLAERNVARVVIGMLDPDPTVHGAGQRLLRKSKIATDFFPADLMNDVEELNRDFTRDRENTKLPEDIDTLADEILSYIRNLGPPTNDNRVFEESVLCEVMKEPPARIAKAMDKLAERGRAKRTAFTGSWFIYA